MQDGHRDGNQSEDNDGGGNGEGDAECISEDSGENNGLAGNEAEDHWPAAVESGERPSDGPDTSGTVASAEEVVLPRRIVPIAALPPGPGLGRHNGRSTRTAKV